MYSLYVLQTTGSPSQDNLPLDLDFNHSI